MHPILKHYLKLVQSHETPDRKAKREERSVELKAVDARASALLMRVHEAQKAFAEYILSRTEPGRPVVEAEMEITLGLLKLPAKEQQVIEPIRRSHPEAREYEVVHVVASIERPAHDLACLVKDHARGRHAFAIEVPSVVQRLVGAVSLPPIYVVEDLGTVRINHGDLIHYGFEARIHYEPRRSQAAQPANGT